MKIFDDYGHHPVEIKAVLRAARDQTEGRVIAIVQPHRFTRLRDLFDDFSASFNDADTVIVAPSMPPAKRRSTGSIERLSSPHPRRRPPRRPLYRGAAGDRPRSSVALAAPGDFVVFLGAGNITQWAYALPGNWRRGAAA